MVSPRFFVRLARNIFFQISLNSLKTVHWAMLGYNWIRKRTKSPNKFLFRISQKWKNAWWLAHGFWSDWLEIYSSKYLLNSLRTVQWAILGYNWIRKRTKSPNKFSFQISQKLGKCLMISPRFFVRLAQNIFFQISFEFTQDC